jgi:DNA helicase II / ATP-dependent DNA helicase PcrA
LQLNRQQQDVVEAIDGVWVVIAGPGSGKTTVLLDRYIEMLMKGIPQKDILNLTFTSAAASEMVRRIGILNADKVFRTFHSYALELLKKERAAVPFQMTETIIPVRGEEYQLLFDLVKMYPAISSFRTLQGKIADWKRTSIEPEQALREAIGKEYYYANAYSDYEERCRYQGWLDFDSLMRESVKMLEDKDDVRKRSARRYISVDECQDTDTTQFKFLQLLFGGNILVVGDENQLIYEWRSAQSGNLTNFERLFPGGHKLYLGQNYRSTKRLVQFFKEIIPVDNGLASWMKTDREEGVDPVLVKYPDADTEARKVLDAASQDPENSVIIARTNRQLFEVQRIATSKGIKYKNLGKKDFWEQNEVKALLSLAKDEPVKTGDACASLRKVIVDHNLFNRYRNTGDTMNSDPIENLNSVARIASDKAATSVSGINLEQFLTYIQRLTYGRKSRKEKDLMLATVHQAKGREWKNVYVIGADQGMMPHKDGELTEEKRIFFVACSRAADNLQISWSQSKSMFLEKYATQPESQEKGGPSIHQQQGNGMAQAQLQRGQ